ncbi:uncharacterized protein LOC126672183 [Mercurialis annua]|uniref:uncharacterized protein LOC126672183 n=1 Tax=Mercurialis annua TaxID=3986 RepID=UPI00215F48C4|nr:uncharacterized protein LOC126672183 [Mercurialis annua]
MLETVSSSQTKESSGMATVHHWSPPPSPYLKINSDAAVSVAKNLSVLSAVCRNSTGEVVRWGVSFLHGCINAEQAEARAVHFGLQIAKDLRVAGLICEMDVLNVANRLRNPCAADDYLQLLIDDCLADSVGMDVRFQFVKHDCNHVAHSLAKWGIFFGRSCVSDGNVPFPVNELVTLLVH